MSNVVNLHRSTELPDEWYAEHLQVDRWPSSGPGARHIVIGAMPSARAGQATPRAVLRRLGHAVPIAIAVFCVVYFGLQLVRSAL